VFGQARAHEVRDPHFVFDEKHFHRVRRITAIWAVPMARIEHLCRVRVAVLRMTFL
jgi:hypothetical protein